MGKGNPLKPTGRRTYANVHETSGKKLAILACKRITMENPIKLTEKYERNGWPSLKRPDLKAPEGWNLSLITSLERICSHALSPDGEMIACIKDGESLSDVFLMRSKGGWLSRLT